MKKVLIFIVFLFVFNPNISFSKKCSDIQILDGSESLVSFGLDSTHHWWAVTSHLSKFRVYIDDFRSAIYDSTSNINFSPDGNRWAFFAKDNVRWYLVTNDSIKPLPGNGRGEIEFSPNSEKLIYSYKESEIEIFKIGSRTIRFNQRVERFFLNYDGSGFAFMGYRGDQLAININGNESRLFDQIKPIGFWYDGKFLYAARSGNLWQIYKDDTPITENFMNIMETRINLEGNVVAALVKRSPNESIGILITDNYKEPIQGKPYDVVYGLVLHPTASLMAYNAKVSNNNLVIYNTTEYYGGYDTGNPQFTSDGSELYFLGCNTDCFVNVNGIRYSLSTVLDPGGKYAMKPGSKTIAFTTASSMVIRYLDQNELVAGRLVDTASAPRYNWRNGRYESLGVINNRLYLMSCEF